MSNQLVPSGTNQGNGKIQEEANALMQNLSIVPSTNNSHTVSTNQSNMEFEVNVMGNMTDCDFYIPDKSGDNTALAFRVAYAAATACYCKDEKKLCAYVGSMLCSVVPGLRESVEEALIGIGISPRFVSLPSQADAYKIVESKLPPLDWPSILVIFGYCFIILFNLVKFNEDSYDFQKKMNKWISELREKVGVAPSNRLDVPFGSSKENIIRTMLGSQSLRKTAIFFLMEKFDRWGLDSKLCDLRRYMSINILSWSGDMCVITLIKDMLERTKSPVLYNFRVLAEVDKVQEACKAISSYHYPQFFNHMCSVTDLHYFDRSRFPTLFAVALELEKGRDGSSLYNVGDSAWFIGTNRRKVNDLVKLHWKAMEGTYNSLERYKSRFFIRGI